MGEINKKYRGKNQTTDVLSFSYAENQLVSQSKLFAAIKKENLFELGDIFIDPMVAKRQAKKSEHSLKKELATLTVHGVLHLLGYDHERSKKDEKRMYGFQEKVLMKL
jgi:rRNA maturation RNase YbeY